MNNKIVVCDLDGTLAPSKSDLTESMSHVINHFLENHRLAVISGGSYNQFQKQFLSHLVCEEKFLANLYLFPTNGSSCYFYDKRMMGWKSLYEEKLTEAEKKKIFAAFEKTMSVSGFDFSGPYGEIVEDREGQITFSGRGQKAPLDIKESWDPDKSKRLKMVEILKKEIPEFEIRIGGATSIDVTRKGITKAYAMRKILEMFNLLKEDVVFIGDALFSGGNDSSVKEVGVECIQVSGPEEAEKVLLEMMKIS